MSGEEGLPRGPWLLELAALADHGDAAVGERVARELFDDDTLAMSVEELSAALDGPHAGPIAQGLASIASKAPEAARVRIESTLIARATDVTDEAERAKATVALGELATDGARVALSRIAENDASDIVRSAAVRALRAFGERATETWSRVAAEDPSASVRALSRNALRARH